MEQKKMLKNAGILVVKFFRPPSSFFLPFIATLDDRPLLHLFFLFSFYAAFCVYSLIIYPSSPDPLFLAGMEPP
jgi:hypothetical protein